MAACGGPRISKLCLISDYGPQWETQEKQSLHMTAGHNVRPEARRRAVLKLWYIKEGISPPRDDEEEQIQ
ncbi:hypothetical protein N7474_007009 [Penicillium riverlandense]|uniref:uncharacterized protein n=1 Tax=Penicillium riverlandense TaxID=1903569 RepID=UPI0025468575|nr:uncharacterized protein N7474_007009 [Penicillium riverlandense]KAJ5815232.1 hypothetical protein N7474_007009 [Penicillium riverlandense]